MGVIPRISNKRLSQLRRKYYKHVPDKAAQEYVEALENRLALAEWALGSVMGEWDEHSNRPSINDYPGYIFWEKDATFQASHYARVYFNEVGGWHRFRAKLEFPEVKRK